ncbi:MAG TPA: imidazoleglycerol-phosphate dehydratase HisB [Candidatus Fimimorpha faecalis]|uniref:Imidazoleglycerol-phosphate dehydratase n=1 Tax=Candidatus Fimimorpha faecalis TaxID=2840824 RepID=A0A9D1EBZ7_9FIRM|nr:imidazoleglycerol-phosphate dehydratase HisB [Candidatus Fimimorpha faecalis]
MEERVATICRTTKETKIELTLNLDGTGKTQINTGIGFLDHMLNSFARHGLFDLSVSIDGDLEVDCHHTIEDTGIVLGQAIAKAVGEKKSMQRYGSIILPMDETLILCAIDLSGRPYLVFDANFTTDRVGNYDTEMVKEFFYAVSYSSGMNLHIRQLAGENNHHIIEGIYKAFAKALDQATRIDSRIVDVLSTKGSL